MRISDWSSDVCSSDHLSLPHRENLLQAEIDPNMISRAVGVIVLVGDGIFAEFRVKLVKVRRSCITIHDAIADFVTAAFLLPACDPHSRSEEHTSELQSLMRNLVCLLLLEKKKIRQQVQLSTINID